MILDTSALVAILWGEPEEEAFVRRIAAADVVRMSAATQVELHLVLQGRLSPEAMAGVARFLARTGALIEPVTEAQAGLAMAAFDRYGRGRHPAALNFGDCFAYALAQAMGEPLLFKGGDFARTDVRPAL